MKAPKSPRAKIKNRPEPKFWFMFFDAFGVEWNVFLGNEESIPQLEGADAVTIPKASLVGVREGLSDVQRALALLHEMDHCAGSTSGDQHVLQHIFKCDPSEVDNVEENVVSFYAPRRFAILHRNGFLKFPKVPK